MDSFESFSKLKEENITVLDTLSASCFIPCGVYRKLHNDFEKDPFGIVPPTGFMRKEGNEDEGGNRN